MTSDTYIVVSVTQMQTPLKVPAVQGDTGRRLTMVFSDLTIPSGAAADIYVRKSDGEIYNSGTVGSADNLSTATFELTSTALEEAGEIPAQVRITDGEDIITSFPFFLCVAESLIDSGAIEGTNEFTALEEAIAAANSATQNANSAASSANQTVAQLQQNYQAATEQAQQQYEAATKINLKIVDGQLVDGDGSSVVLPQEAIPGELLYRVSGKIFASSDGSDPIEGYGIALISVLGATAKIDFDVSITTAGTSTTNVSYGLLTSLLEQGGAPEITPQGIFSPAIFFRGEGLYSAANGYAGSMYGVSTGWRPGRIYTTNGDYGDWGTNTFAVGDRITGTVYGTVGVIDTSDLQPQSKTVTPATTAQTVVADSGYYLSPVTVEAIPQADYIVEQGTSGIWTYRKYNSGLVEAWARPELPYLNDTNLSIDLTLPTSVSSVISMLATLNDTNTESYNLGRNAKINISGSTVTVRVQDPNAGYKSENHQRVSVYVLYR